MKGYLITLYFISLIIVWLISVVLAVINIIYDFNFESVLILAWAVIIPVGYLLIKLLPEEKKGE